MSDDPKIEINPHTGFEARGFKEVPVLFGEFQHEPDEEVIRIADELQGIINEAMADGADRVSIRWVNVWDRDTNPDRKCGHLKVTAFRNITGASCVPRKMVPRKMVPRKMVPRKMADGSTVQPIPHLRVGPPDQPFIEIKTQGIG